jgi:ACR3 family arsenite efflux pump ArsB
MATLNTWLVSFLLDLARYCYGSGLEWSCWWNQEYAAGLIALNSIFKLYGVYAYVFYYGASSYFGYTGFDVNISIGQIAESVGIYLGIPLHWESSVDML